VAEHGDEVGRDGGDRPLPRRRRAGSEAGAVVGDGRRALGDGRGDEGPRRLARAQARLEHDRRRAGPAHDGVDVAAGADGHGLRPRPHAAAASSAGRMRSSAYGTDSGVGVLSPTTSAYSSVATAPVATAGSAA
jgi:hypothetical protein